MTWLTNIEILLLNQVLISIIHNLFNLVTFQLGSNILAQKRNEICLVVCWFFFFGKKICLVVGKLTEGGNLRILHGN